MHRDSLRKLCSRSRKKRRKSAKGIDKDDDVLDFDDDADSQSSPVKNSRNVLIIVVAVQALSQGSSAADSSKFKSSSFSWKSSSRNVHFPSSECPLQLIPCSPKGLIHKQTLHVDELTVKALLK